MIIRRKIKQQLEDMKAQIPEFKEHKNKLEKQYSELLNKRRELRDQFTTTNDPQLKVELDKARIDLEMVRKHLSEVTERIQWMELITLPKIYMNRMCYTDIEPYEVVKINTVKNITIRPMKSVETQESKAARIASFIPGGFCGHTDNSVQQWDITSDETIDEKDYITVRMHKDGRYYDAQGGVYIMSKTPTRYYDFNF
jgi:hypothetical protein